MDQQRDNCKAGSEESDSDGEDSQYDHLFQSMRSDTGLEIAINVTWPGVKDFKLDTRLPSTEIAPMFHGTQWAGTRVWRAAIVAIQYLLSDIMKEEMSDVKSVLELGCGLGVPGMILHAAKGYDTTLTDMGSLVEQLQKNLDANQHLFDPERIRARTLDWSIKDINALISDSEYEMYDLVLNCDCIYEPLYGDSWESLFACQEELLRQKPSMIMITSVERRKFDGLEKYLSRLEESSAISRVTKVDLLQFLDASEIRPEIEIYRIYGQ